MTDTEQTRKEMLDLIVKLAQGEHELCEMMKEMASNVAEAMKKNDMKVPDNFEEELVLSIRAANIAITAAHLASTTEGTEEGGMDAALVLGLWSGTLMQARAQEARIDALRSFLGLGDN
jgi:hypothetical protein